MSIVEKVRPIINKYYYLIKCIFLLHWVKFSIIYFSLLKWACRSIALPMNYCTVQYSACGVYSTDPSWPLNTISDWLSVLTIGQLNNSLFNQLGIGRLRHKQQWLHLEADRFPSINDADLDALLDIKKNTFLVRYWVINLLFNGFRCNRLENLPFGHSQDLRVNIPVYCTWNHWITE